MAEKREIGGSESVWGQETLKWLHQNSSALLPSLRSFYEAKWNELRSRKHKAARQFERGMHAIDFLLMPSADQNESRGVWKPSVETEKPTWSPKTDEDEALDVMARAVHAEITSLENSFLAEKPYENKKLFVRYEFSNVSWTVNGATKSELVLFVFTANGLKSDVFADVNEEALTQTNPAVLRGAGDKALSHFRQRKPVPRGCKLWVWALRAKDVKLIKYCVKDHNNVVQDEFFAKVKGNAFAKLEKNEYQKLAEKEGFARETSSRPSKPESTSRTLKNAGVGSFG